MTHHPVFSGLATTALYRLLDSTDPTEKPEFVAAIREELEARSTALADLFR